MKNNKTKEKTISLRCTEKEYTEIKKKSQSENKTISEYLLDQKIPRRQMRAKERKRIPIMVELQECTNQLVRYQNENPELSDELSSVISDLQKGVIKLWVS